MSKCTIGAYLLAVVGGVLHAHQVSVRPSVEIGVLPADVSVPGVARLALAAEHWVSKVSQVVTAGVLVAVVASVQARVAGRTHLGDEGRRGGYACLTQKDTRTVLLEEANGKALIVQDGGGNFRRRQGRVPKHEPHKSELLSVA